MANELYATAQPAQTTYQTPQITLPKLTSLQDILGTTTPEANTSNIYKLLMTNTGSASEIIPTLQDLLTSNNSSAITSLRQGAQSNAAKAQSEAMKRGLTGSDIEAANMTSAYAKGEESVGNLLAQQSATLAQYIMQAYGLDVQSNREMFTTLAQALGQELQSQRDMEMAAADRDAMVTSGRTSGQYGLLGSLIGAAGTLGAGALISDIRLKTSPVLFGKKDGINIYKWDWNEKAKSLGHSGEPNIGVIAQEVEKIHPGLVVEIDGFKAVNYGGLPAEVQKEIARLRG